MQFGLFSLCYEFLLGFSVVRHFGSERSSLFGLLNFRGSQSSPYFVACNTSLGSGKSEHHLSAYIEEIICIQVSNLVSDLLVLCMNEFRIHCCNVWHPDISVQLSLYSYGFHHSLPVHSNTVRPTHPLRTNT